MSFIVNGPTAAQAMLKNFSEMFIAPDAAFSAHQYRADESHPGSRLALCIIKCLFNCWVIKFDIFVS